MEMKYLPAFVLATERLILREADLQDAPFVLQLLNDPAFIQNVWDAGIRTVEAAEDYIRNKMHFSYQEYGHGGYLVELRSTGELIGTCGLTRRKELDLADLGFSFLPTHCGHGYALEAAQGLATYARNTLRMEKILAVASPDNSSSIRLLEKLGMTLEPGLSLPGIDEAGTAELKIFGMKL